MAMHDRIDSEAAGRLLLIDRDAACAQTIAETLRQSLGNATRISVAAGGRQGADLLRERPFDIVLADLSSLADLSERSGEAVMRLVRLAEGALVVALSDGVSVSAAVAAMRAGAHDYVAKPINGPAMVARIANYIARFEVSLLATGIASERQIVELLEDGIRLVQGPHIAAPGPVRPDLVGEPARGTPQLRRVES